MARVVVFRTITGDIELDVPFASYTWETTINQAETLSCKVLLSDPDAAALDFDAAATGLKYSLAIIEGLKVVAAGPIWPHDYGKSGDTLTISAMGEWSIFYKRLVMPVAALTTPLLVTTGDDAGKPNPSLETNFVGKSWPYIVRRLLQQSMAFPNGSLPLVFGPDGIGSHDKSYDAASLKTVGSALDDLVQLDEGPEIQFQPRLRDDRKGIEFVVRVGDDSQLRLMSNTTPQKWDYSVPELAIDNLEVTTDWSGLASASWATGGKPAAVALVALRTSTALTDAGFPWTDTVDTTHTDVVIQSTLNSYAASNLKYSARPVQFWPFAVRKDLSPTLSEWDVGDLSRLKVKDDSYIPDGTYTRRIVSASGDEGDWVKITTGGVYA